MPVVNPEKLIGLQRNAEEVRNVCILSSTYIPETNERIDMYTRPCRK